GWGDRGGGLEDRLVVTLDPAKMAAAGVSMQQVIGVVQANNLTIPGGALPTEGARIPVSTIGHFDTKEQIESLVVGVKQPASVPATPASPAAPAASGAPGAAVTPAAPTPVTLGAIGKAE